MWIDRGLRRLWAFIQIKSVFVRVHPWLFFLCDLGALRVRTCVTSAGTDQGRSSLTGRTSIVPSRAGGIFAAIWIASSRSAASTR